MYNQIVHVPFKAVCGSGTRFGSDYIGSASLSACVCVAGSLDLCCAIGNYTTIWGTTPVAKEV